MKIALDVDDVLCAFTPHAHNYYGIPLVDKLDYWSAPHMDSVLGKGWFGNIVPEGILGDTPCAVLSTGYRF